MTTDGDQTDLIQSVLFDLDGTLTDPIDGISNCIRHALDHLQIECPGNAELAQFIGPPLRPALARLCKSNDEELIELAVKVFRERFSTIGLFENEVYDGIPEALETLFASGKTLFVATAKPEKYAKQILEHFNLDRYFKRVFGNDATGSFDDKADLLIHAIKVEKLDPFRSVMIGDRASDIEAGRIAGIKTVAVCYGYGTPTEIEKSRPDAVCDLPTSLAETIFKLGKT